MSQGLAARVSSCQKETRSSLDLQCRVKPKMKKSRTNFLKGTSAGLLSVAGATEAQTPSDLPPGAPPAFNTAPAAGPVVSPATFAGAEKLVQVELTQPQRAMAARSWRTSMAPLYERRTGPHKVELETTLAPGSN